MKAIKTIKTLKLNTILSSEAIQQAKRFNKRSDSTFRGGFSLIEMLVALGIFTTTVVGVLGIMLTVLNVQRKTAEIQSVFDNVRFGLELITKELRTGEDYQLTTFCAASGSEITFFASSDGNNHTYFLETNSLSPNFGIIMRANLTLAQTLSAPDDCDGSPEAIDNGIEAVPFTSEDVKVTRLRFLLRGENPGPDDGQPFITILLGAEGRNPKILQQTTMNLQTSVVQRGRDQ